MPSKIPIKAKYTNNKPVGFSEFENNDFIGIEFGGTGANTSNSALNNLLPSQEGNNGKALLTNGSNTYWGTVSTSASGSIVIGGSFPFWNNSGEQANISLITTIGTTIVFPFWNGSGEQVNINLI